MIEGITFSNSLNFLIQSTNKSSYILSEICSREGSLVRQLLYVFVKSREYVPTNARVWLFLAFDRESPPIAMVFYFQKGCFGMMDHRDLPILAFICLIIFENIDKAPLLFNCFLRTTWEGTVNWLTKNFFN